MLAAAATTGTVDQHVGPKSKEAERLKEALVHFDQAACIAERERHPQVRALALIGASFAKEMLGDRVQAEKDVESAYECCPDEPPVLVSYSTLLRTRGKPSEAIQLLRKANKGGAGEQGAFLLAESLSKRSDPGDL
jgi:tetratricopeptide (TPR) repeat protein